MASDKNQVNLEEKVEEPLLQNSQKKTSTKTDNEEVSIRDKKPQAETKRTKSKSKSNTTLAYISFVKKLFNYNTCTN